MVGIVRWGRCRLVDGSGNIGDRLLDDVLLGLECKSGGIGLCDWVEVRLRCVISDKSEDKSEDRLGDNCSGFERIEFQNGSGVTEIELFSSSETE